MLAHELAQKLLAGPNHEVMSRGGEDSPYNLMILDVVGESTRIDLDTDEEDEVILLSVSETDSEIDD